MARINCPDCGAPSRIVDTPPRNAPKQRQCSRQQSCGWVE